MKKLPLIVFLCFITSITIVSAQDTCPAMVEMALQATETACKDLGRNEICYGHVEVSVLDFDQQPLANFAGSGDVAPVETIRYVNTTPLQVDEGVWGVAMLSLQANLPDTLPGQNVTFIVFGDVQLENQVTPDSISAPPPTLDAEVTSGVNVRSGPGTQYSILGALAAGDTVTVKGRNAAGDWLQIDYDGQTAWVFASLLAVNGDSSTLAVIEAGSEPGPGQPFQAFQLSTGVGEVQCSEAPRDGVLVQTPGGTTVNFLINGIEVTVGSTAFFRTPTEADLEVSVLEGTVTMTSGDITRTATTGQTITVPAEPPSEQSSVPEPTIYNEEAVTVLPIDLLPEVINVAYVIPGTADWVDTGVAVAAGQTVTIVGGGAVNPCATSANDQPPPPEICKPWGPEGVTTLGPVPGNVIDSVTVGALIGRVGDDGGPFLVGDGVTFTTDKAGTLQFRVNDEPLFNNSGAFTVVITNSE